MARSITTEAADRALRIALAAWLRQSPSRTDFRIEHAFDAARAEAATDHVNPGAGIAPSITVAICTRNRPLQVERALTAIGPALRATDQLLVVLNAPTIGEATPGLERFPDARFVVEPRPGLNWARNRALIEFRSDVVLFTDDDCVPDANWIEAHRSVFARNPDVDVVIGLIEPLELATPAQVLFEHYGGFARGYLRRWISAPRRKSVAHVIGNTGEFGAGANFAIRRRLIERVGPFDAALGAGTATGGGDELEFLFRALKSGALLAYEPRAIVQHEHRRELVDLEAQIEGWSSGFACAIERSMCAYPEEVVAYRMLQARIALLYHLRRALFSPSRRRLAMVELRGMRGAAQRYATARRSAEELAATIPSPSSDASPYGPRSAHSVAPRGETRIECVSVDVETVREPLIVSNGADELSVAVHFRGKQIGAVVLPVFHGAVGADRLLDAVIDRLGGTIIGGNWGSAVRGSQQHLADAARGISPGASRQNRTQPTQPPPRIP